MPCLFTSELQVLSLANKTVASTVPSQQAKPTMGTVSWNGKYWVVEDTLGKKNEVTVYSLANPTDPQQLAVLTPGVMPTTDEITPNSRYAFEICAGNPKTGQHGSIEVIALSQHPRMVKSIPLPGYGDTVGAFSPNGQYFYTNLASANAVAVINVKSQALVKTIPVGQVPGGIFAGTYQWIKHS